MRSVNVNEVIDKSKMNRFFWVVIIVAVLALICDGYSMNVFGVIVPSLIKNMGISPVQAGLLGSYGLYGMIVGSILAGIIADRIGRIKTVAACIIWFAVFTGITGFATSPTQIGILRFLAGIGLAGVVPNIVALASEYSPLKNRALIVSVASMGVPIGTILAAGIGILVVQNYGWQAMFFVGFITILSALLVVKFMPESMVFNIKLGRKAKIAATLQAAQPDFVPSDEDEYKLGRPGGPGASFTSLFKDGLAGTTVLFCLAFFFQIFIIFGLQTWLPNLMTRMGYPLGTSLWFLLTFNLGGIVGAVACGIAADKFGFKKALAFFFLVSAILIALLSIRTNIIILSVMLFVTGLCVFGIQGVMPGFMALNYPLPFRSSAVGLGMGVGRFGGALGPTVGGILLAAHVPMSVNFYAFAIPALINIVIIFVIKNSSKAN